MRWACRASGIETPPEPTELPSASTVAAAELLLEILETDPPDLQVWAADREQWLVASEACGLVGAHLSESSPLSQFTAMMRDAAAMASIRTTERLDDDRLARIHNLAPLYLRVLELLVAASPIVEHAALACHRDSLQS